MGAQAAYNYIDQAPRWGEQFYRIRMIGMNGGQVISPSERVVVKRKDMYNVSIIPNQVSTQLTIRYWNRTRRMPPFPSMIFWAGRSIRRLFLRVQTGCSGLFCMAGWADHGMDHSGWETLHYTPLKDEIAFISSI
ncbi:MAG: hypothetical protein R2787_02165 [Saprospiraceae bacterium]